MNNGSLPTVVNKRIEPYGMQPGNSWTASVWGHINMFLDWPHKRPVENYVLRLSNGDEIFVSQLEYESVEEGSSFDPSGHEKLDLLNRISQMLTGTVVLVGVIVGVLILVLLTRMF